MKMDRQTVTVTAAELAEGAVEDFVSFFDPAAGFQLRLGFSGSSIARCVGVGATGGIVMSEGFKLQPVESMEDLIFVLLILSHEIAHYVHLHNAAQELSTEDDRSLEDWADFYGAKVMMTLTLCGPMTGPLFQRRQERMSTDEVYVEMGSALARLADSVFPSSSRSYSNALTRVGHSVCGILSVVDSITGRKDLNRSMAIQELLYGHHLLQRLMKEQGQAYLTDDSPERSLNIHRSLQSNSAGITPGLRPELQRFLDTCFDTNDAAIAQRVNKAMGGLKRQELQR
jgi:hypothetical protein